MKQFLPPWAHPRAPIVAISLRSIRSWEYRLNIFARQIIDIVFSFWVIFIILSPLICMISIALGLELLESLLILAIIALSPFGVGFAELLYARLWIASPPRTAQMIAGEIERRTWEIMCSTPFPSRQIVLGKMAALYWGADASLILISSLRFIMLTGIFVSEALNNNYSIDIYQHIIWWLLLLGMPIWELFHSFSLGLFISSKAANVRAANLLTLGGQILYRLISVVLVLIMVGNVERSWLPIVFLLPHWAFVPMWGAVELSSGLLISLLVSLTILPIIFGIFWIWLTTRTIR